MIGLPYFHKKIDKATMMINQNLFLKRTLKNDLILFLRLIIKFYKMKHLFSIFILP